MNTNNYTYTIVYASLVVIVVAFLLAVVSKVLEPQSLANERIDKKKQILASLNVRDVPNSDVESKYEELVLQDIIVDVNGQVVAEGNNHDKDGFALSMKEISPEKLPIYVCQVSPGEDGKKFVFPLIGKGLWGSIWGYIALNSDLRTVYGTYFSHQSETAGLGARITELAFQNQFVGKVISKDGSQDIDLTVVKSGRVQDTAVECDGITGATLTCNGVSDMLHDCLSNYKNYLKFDEK